MGKRTVFTNAKVYTPEGVIDGGSVFVKDGRIEAISTKSFNGRAENVDQLINLNGQSLVPGFIDVHVHGGGGYDAMRGCVEDIDGMSLFHAQHGTTSFLPTTLTADPLSIEKAIDSIVKTSENGTRGAEVLGVHLEGPFINEKRSGAQNLLYIREPSIEELDRYCEIAKGNIRLMTLAPEQPGAIEFIRHAFHKGVTISIGHSDATYHIVKQAIEAGANHITHLFNGMRPLHHREPGVAGTALMSDELAVELICDGFHIHPDLINYVFRTKSLEKIILITDAVSAAGQPNGDNYELGGLPCYMKDGQVRLKESNDLAGSCLTMIEALRNALAFTGRPLQEILPTLTINPARQIGVSGRKGSIEIGKDADLIVLDDNIKLQATYVKGEEVYSKGCQTP